MKYTFNLAFLVKVCLSDKRFSYTHTPRNQGEMKENMLVIGDEVYHRPFVQLSFSGSVSATKYFDTYEDATKFANEMSGYINNKLEIED